MLGINLSFFTIKMCYTISKRFDIESVTTGSVNFANQKVSQTQSQTVIFVDTSGIFIQLPVVVCLLQHF